MLFFSVGNRISPGCVKKIIDEYDVKNAYGILSEGTFDTSFFRDVLLFGEIAYGRYPDTFHPAPLDEVILADYSDTVMSTLHLIERNGFNFEKYAARERIYFLHLRYWLSILKEWEIDSIFFGIIPHEIPDYIVYNICRKQNIRTYMFYDTMIADHACAMMTYDNQGIIIREEYKKLKKEFENRSIDEIILNDTAKSIFEKLSSREENMTTPYTITMGERKEKEDTSAADHLKVEQAEEIKRQFHFPISELYTNWKEEGGNIRSFPNFLRRVYWSEKKYYKGKKATEAMRAFYQEHAITPAWDEKFIYFPLHYQPELKTSPLGGYYADLRLIAEILSYNSPEDVKIYIKEHPLQTIFGRDENYYRDLLDIPKIKLIKLEESSYSLIKNCIAVASVTGSAGFEGQFYGKSFLMFGDYITESMEGTYRIHTNEDCRKAIEEILAGTNYVMSIKELKLFMKAMDLHSFKYGAPDDEVFACIKEVMDLEDNT